MPLDTSWSQYRDHADISRLAAHLYQVNSQVRRYHTWEHVDRLYHHAEHTFGFPYHEALDAAIMWHDVVYDHLPQKELRSADLWLATYPLVGGISYDISRQAYALIMTTVDHVVTDELSEQLILLDLADLMDPEQTLINYDLIEEESMLLYGITREQAAQASFEFMTHFQTRIYTNWLRPGTQYGEQWEAIAKGVAKTLSIAHSRA